MAGFVRGDVVVVPFPFSDLTQAKRRPALVIATLEGDDVILSQITSKTVRDRYSISLEESDFERGSLKQPSNIRPNRIFTADSHIILYSVGSIKTAKLAQVVDKTIAIIQGEKNQ
ncbi:MAG: type II toxin-antitoxin system PemK/MazF family toxin [Nitrospiraceae bacterium]|nr:type II toxin-antitoxin system PemK/MazF family toxin [Nitrospiraceae bacterium]